MYSIEKSFCQTQIIKKSTFICNIFPIKNMEEANEVIQAVRKKYYDASHNCYALIYGNNGEYSKCSDDGEPSQTAGVVMLDALIKNNMTNIIAICTRYFGGIKLGAGGLVRAYSSSVSMTIKEADILELKECVKTTFITNYSNFSLLDRYLSSFNLNCTDKDFKDNVSVSYIIPIEIIDEITKKSIEITKNQIEIIKNDIIQIYTH